MPGHLIYHDATLSQSLHDFAGLYLAIMAPANTLATIIAVTGGCGFVGSAIVRSLQEYLPECKIVIFDKEPMPGRALTEECLKVDVTSLSQVEAALSLVRPDIIIHTAGYVPPLNQRYSRAQDKAVKHINVGGTRNVLKAAVDCRCKGLIYTSSCCAVTDDLDGHFANIDEDYPVSRKSLPYGESKVEAEELVIAANSSNFVTCVLRPAVIFGEGDYQLVPSIHACIAKGEALFRLGDGNNLWDTVYVSNVADAHALAVKNLLSSKTAAGETFFIQNNEPISFREFSLAIWKEFGYYPPFEVQIPVSLGWIVGLIAECWAWLSGLPTTISRGSTMDACAMRYATGDKAARLLEYKPRIGLGEGLKRSCRVSVNAL